MICTSLVPLDIRQQCAMFAIATIEARRKTGRPLGEFAHAKAFFRKLTGKPTISVHDVRLVDVTYAPSIRGGSTKMDYIKALDVLIESRGEQLMPPLAYSVAAAMFPSRHSSKLQRREHKELMYSKHDKHCQLKEELRKIAIHENVKKKALISLQFCRPGEHWHWLTEWRDELNEAGIREMEICSMLSRWWALFWITAYRSDWRWCDTLLDLMDEIDYVIKTTPQAEMMACHAALPLTLPDLSR